MYFIKYEPLKTLLRARSLGDREALPYLVLFAGLTALVGGLPAKDGFNIWDTTSVVLSVILAIAGVAYAYYQNGAGEGYDLIQKYVVLGWVVAVRFIIIAVPVAVALVALGDFMGLVSYDSTGWFDVAVIALFEAFLYQRIGRHIRDTRGISSEQGGGGYGSPAAGSPSSHR